MLPILFFRWPVLNSPSKAATKNYHYSTTLPRNAATHNPGQRKIYFLFTGSLGTAVVVMVPNDNTNPWSLRLWSCRILVRLPMACTEPVTVYRGCKVSHGALIGIASLFEEGCDVVDQFPENESVANPTWPLSGSRAKYSLRAIHSKYVLNVWMIGRCWL